MSGGYKGKGWFDLKKYLEISATNSGFSIFSNGGKVASSTSSTKHYRVLKCTHGVKYKNSILLRKSQQYRNVSVINDRLNNRSDGKSLSRRSATCRPCTTTKCCPFSLQISFDSSGFFLVNGKGNCSHSGHPLVTDKASIFPARLLDDAERRIAESIIRADASNGIIQNVVNKRNGLALTRHNCYYLSRLTSAIEGIDCLKELSSSDKLLQFLKDKKYDYLSLFNQDSNFSNHKVLVTDNYVSSKSLFCNTDYILPANELADATKFSNEHRNKMNLTHEQNLLLAVAWVIPSEKDHFFLFPEVLRCWENKQ